jgi:large subunit ribosomal protein L13
MRTYSPKPGDNTPVWHVIDAEDVVLGRLATHAATLLRGKHKPSFAPHMDMGDSYAELLESNPRRAVEKAVKGMLPHNKLGRQQIKKLKVYAGSEHPHAAQQPQPFQITQVAQ